MTKYIFGFLLFCTPFLLPAQDEGSSLLDLIEEEETTNYATASFKSTHIINSQSIENVAGGVLDFRISHRFGRLNSGINNLYGLDQATLRIGFDYGITDRLMIGFGRSTVQKALDGSVKYKLLRQSTGKKTMPVTLSLYSSIAANMLEWASPEIENYFTSRLTYTYQILVGRKMSEGTTLMIMPTLVHRNFVLNTSIKNDVYILGIGGRQKLSNRIALTGEYYYVFPDQIEPIYHNSLSVGIDIETGGHVFQLQFTNSIGLIDKSFMTETTGQWSRGDIHFGFNISRVFTIKERKNKPE